MKTIEVFIKEIDGSADLQNEIKAIKDKDALERFLKKNDVGGTSDDFAKAVKAKNETEGKIPDELTDMVAGGVEDGIWREDDPDGWFATMFEKSYSIFK